jgi:hypothetical protein
MLSRFAHRFLYPLLGVLALAVTVAPDFLPAAVAPGAYHEPESVEALHWQTAARWRHGLKKTSGTLLFNNQGVEFQTSKEPPLHWSFEEIQTFKLAPHLFKLTGYQNRKWRLHGERSFLFELKFAVPPEVAAQLARRVEKPVENADPSADAPAFASIPARHRTRAGGTNGVLRFRDAGIDYVAAGGRGARSWRWQDIQTIANPDPYHFRVGGYRETFNFDLKQPMSKQLFDRLWNRVYAGDLSGLNLKGGARR